MYKESNFKKVDGVTYVFEPKVEDMLKENEERWSSKSFYKPKKTWRKVWEENLYLEFLS